MDQGGLYVGAGQVVGVAIGPLQEDRPYTWVHLRRGRKAMHLIAHGTAATAEELLKTTGTRVPMALCIDHERCVHRAVAAEGPLHDLLPLAFPNAPVDDLCVSVRAHSGASGCSMMRRAQALELLAPFESAGARVVDLTIGPWDLLGLAPLLGSADDALTLHRSRFVRAEGSLRLERVDADGAAMIQLGPDRLPAAQALAFATAWAWAVPTEARASTHADLVLGARSQEKARLRYERLLVGALLLFVILFGGEWALQRTVAAERARTDGNVQDRVALLKAVEQERQLLQERQALAQALGVDSLRRLAVQAAAIAATVPAGIRLDRLALDPLQAPLQEREPVRIARGVALVRGTCARTELLNAWMDSLRTVRGVRGVRLLGYRLAADGGDPVFDLEITT
ncbi:MAG: hypothetical protein JNL05_04240 [Flavobacteriales bacterium]|nr:hypothetical protein [Flavobacteriales bacterium]